MCDKERLLVLLDDAASNGVFIGEGKSVKGAKYMVFKHNERYFTGVFTSDNGEYVCGAEEISKDDVGKYIPT